MDCNYKILKMKSLRVLCLGKLFLLCCLSLSWVQSSAHNIEGLPISTDAHDEITGFFTDPSGNRLILFSSGNAGGPGNASVVKINANCNDTLLRSFALPDTSTVLYAGFCTTQHTYLFIGLLSRDTLPLFSDYACIYVLETDTFLHVIAAGRYALPGEYYYVSGMKGFLPSGGNFAIAGTALGNSASAFRDDVFLMEFNTYGDTLRSKFIRDPLPDELIYYMPNPDGLSFSLITKGFNSGSGFQRLTFDPDWNMTSIQALFPGEMLSSVMSALWISDTSFLISSTLNSPENYYDIIIREVGISGLFYREHVFGGQQNIDFPAYKQALIPSGDGGCFLAGTLNAGMFYYFDTIMVARLDSTLNIQWIRYFHDVENYTVEAIIPSSSGGCLIASSFFNQYNPGQLRDLFFFQLNADGYAGGIPDDEPLTGYSYQLFPNPGSSYLQFTTTDPDECVIEVKDLSGRTVLSPGSFAHNAVVDVAALPSGMYLVVIQTSESFPKALKWVKY